MKSVVASSSTVGISRPEETSAVSMDMAQISGRSVKSETPSPLDAEDNDRRSGDIGFPESHRSLLLSLIRSSKLSVVALKVIGPKS